MIKCCSLSRAYNASCLCFGREGVKIRCIVRIGFKGCCILNIIDWRDAGKQAIKLDFFKFSIFRFIIKNDQRSHWFNDYAKVSVHELRIAAV